MTQGNKGGFGGGDKGNQGKYDPNKQKTPPYGQQDKDKGDKGKGGY